jgi:nucleoside-diphosphate-sugar epimerase
VQYLLDAGHRILALTRRAASAKFIPSHERVTLLEGDLDNAPDDIAAKVVAECSGVISAVHLRHSVKLAEELAKRGWAPTNPFVALSSARFYSQYDGDSTRIAIQSAEEKLEQLPLSAVVLRPTMIYGGGRDANIERLIRWVERRGWFPAIGGGRALIQPVHRSDVARLAVACFEQFADLSNPESAPNNFAAIPLGGGDQLSMAECIQSITLALKEHGLIKRTTTRIIPIPSVLIGPAGVALGLLKRRSPAAYTDSLRRMTEDKIVDNSRAQEVLSRTPLTFSEGLELALKERAN